MRELFAEYAEAFADVRDRNRYHDRAGHEENDRRQDGVRLEPFQKYEHRQLRKQKAENNQCDQEEGRWIGKSSTMSMLVPTIM